MRIDDVGGSHISRPAPTSAAAPATPVTNSAPASASTMFQQATPKGATRPDVQQLAMATKSIHNASPTIASMFDAQIATMLTPVEYGQYTRAVDEIGALSGNTDVKHRHLNDPDYKGIPQGQGYDSKTNEFLTTYYSKTDGNNGTDVRLSIQNKDTDDETAYVKLKGPNGTELSHGGGVAVSGNWVLVSDGGKVYSYDRAEIAAAKSGAEIEPNVVLANVPKRGNIYAVSDTKVGSFINVSPDGKYAYVGEFDLSVRDGKNNETKGYPELYRYEIDQKTGMLTNKSGPQRIPNNAQGVAVTDDGLIFTTSYGSKSGISPNEVIFQEFAMKPSKGFALEAREDAKVVAEIPYYAEGTNVIGNTLYVTHESGAEEYKGEDGIQFIQKYPLDGMNW